MEYVYRLVDLRDGIPFYVGITDNPHRRLGQHIQDSTSNPEKFSKIQEIIQAGSCPKLEVIEILEIRKEAEKQEQFWILEYLTQGCLLTNIVHTPKARTVHDIFQPMNEVPILPMLILPKKKAVGWLQFFEIDEAWTTFLDGLVPTLEAMERFYATFSSDRLPILREKDQKHLDIWYSCERFRLVHPNNDWHGIG